MEIHGAMMYIPITIPDSPPPVERGERELMRKTITANITKKSFSTPTNDCCIQYHFEISEVKAIVSCFGCVDLIQK